MREGVDVVEVEALGRTWKWPAQDEKCRRVVFEWSADLKIALKHVTAFDLCVQAGGNMGVWPWLLARRFTKVITFEPDPICYPLLVENVKDRKNVLTVNSGLGAERSRGRMVYCESNNLGAQYLLSSTGDKAGLSPTTDIPIETIDSYDLPACDLIYLDIEGGELNALKGAYQTIDKYKPVIVVEDKGLSERYGSKRGAIEAALFDFAGYRVVARPHRDVVLVCR